MARIINSAASDVFPQEVNVSQVIRTAALTRCGVVGTFERGPLGPRLITSNTALRQLYGKHIDSLGPYHLCSQDYLDVGSQLWVNRVVGANAAYAGAFLTYRELDDGSDTPRWEFNADGVVDPELVNFATGLRADSEDVNIGYLYGIGPGAAYDSIRLAINTNNVPILNASLITGAAVAASTGFDAGFIYYYITSIDYLGVEHYADLDQVFAVEIEEDDSVELSFTPDDKVWGYRIYRSTTGDTVGPDFVEVRSFYRNRGNDQTWAETGLLNGGDLEFVDDETIVLGTKRPPSTITFSSAFKLEVYDYSRNVNFPVEVFDLSANPVYTADMDVTNEMAAVINTQSQYIRVKLNPIFEGTGLPTADRILDVPRTQFSGGDDGTNAIDSDFIAGYRQFADREAIAMNILMSGGNTSPFVHAAMVALAEERMDCIAILDPPRSKLKAQDLVTYRQFEANINSNRGLLATPYYERVDNDTKHKITMPMSGIYAQKFAYTDEVRNAATSPAGLQRGVVFNALNLTHKYTEGERDMLARVGISYARQDPNLGIYLAEQLTLAGEFSALSFANVRRAVDIVRLALQDALQYNLHENNLEFTRSQINNMMVDYLEFVKKDELIGAYRIEIDATPATRGQGLLAINLYIEPVLPINQIALRVFITRQGEVSFEEIH